MFFKFIRESLQGPRQYNKKTINVPVFSNLLENLRCHSTDEYPVISSEDESPIPPLACSFSKGKRTGHILALVDECGSVVLYNTNLAGDQAYITDWVAHNNAVFDVEWMAQEQKLLTASGDQTIGLWDVPSKKKLLTFKGHSSSVRSVRYRPQDDAVFASGSRDGHVRLWDTRCNVTGEKVSCVGVIKNAHSISQQASSRRKKSRLGPAQDCQQSVTSVLFQNDNLLTTSGAVDGCVKVWDIRKIKSDCAAAVYNFPYTGISKRTHGFSSLTFDTYFTKLFANCTDDMIYCYDFISYKPEPVCTYKGHRNTSFYVKSVLSPDNEFLLSGSTDEHAYIWQVSKPNASPVILKGHRSEISDVAWCKTDLFRLVTTSDDNTVRVWRYDSTAELRKKLGRTDISCGITGSAERTHRDIGTSVDPGPQTPKRSPKSALKRSATLPFGPVKAVTPKQSKTSISASPSPSIKMWLKRSASAPSADTLRSSINQTVSPTADSKGQSSGAERCVGSEHSAAGPSASEEASCSPAKKQKLETLVSERDSSRDNRLAENNKAESVKGDIQENEKPTVRKSCKRKLVDDTSPQKCKKQRVGSDMDSENFNVITEDKENSPSPQKEKTLFKDSYSEFSDSPAKKQVVFTDAIQSPARISLKELDSNIYQSPTANLPNLVVDGPQRKNQTGMDEDKKKGVDWLTQMRIQKMAKQSPQNKKCRGKLLDKLCESSSTESSQETERSPVSSPKVKSPVHGVRSITSFFARPALKS
ncbi:denticleless protein homolog [Mercenaria mercenaria]|uniref:denticleless protein homolog n=1 Tax=Mercenaria mercenaria TaxID=6596 RepID=UPI00234FA208|nr:denticleless protein homolog [Mercenaria mercenaria]